MTKKIEFNEEKHEYTVDGQKVYGFSEILKVLGITKPVESLEASHQAMIKKAGDFGKVVHKWCEIYDRKEMDQYGTPPLEVMPYLDAWGLFCFEHLAQWTEIETMHYNEQHNYCGTPDRYGLVLGKKTVVDIKTAKTVSWTAKLQTYAYRLFYAGVNELPERLIVQLCEDGSYHLYGTEVYGKQRKAFLDNSEDGADWFACLRVMEMRKE